MFENNLTSIKNVDVFASISLVIFTIMFAGVVIWVLRMKKEFVNHMENLPVSNDEESLIKGESNE